MMMMIRRRRRVLLCPRSGFYFDAPAYNLLFNLKSYQYYSSFLVFTLPRHHILPLRLSLPYIHEFYLSHKAEAWS